MKNLNAKENSAEMKRTSDTWTTKMSHASAEKQQLLVHVVPPLVTQSWNVFFSLLTFFPEGETFFFVSFSRLHICAKK